MADEWGEGLNISLLSSLAWVSTLSSCLWCLLFHFFLFITTATHTFVFLLFLSLHLLFLLPFLLGVHLLFFISVIANGENFIWDCMRVYYEWKILIKIIHVRKHQVIVESFKVTDD